MLPGSKVLLPQAESKAHLPFPHRASRDSEATKAICLFTVFQPPSVSSTTFVGTLDLVVTLFRYPFL